MKCHLQENLVWKDVTTGGILDSLNVITPKAVIIADLVSPLVECSARIHEICKVYVFCIVFVFKILIRGNSPLVG